MRIFSLFILFTAILGDAIAASDRATTVNPRHREWVTQMKQAERGPFSRIRWFCKDGQVLPPTAYACKDFGGGAQHGEWSNDTLRLREAGYQIANFYADLDIDNFVQDTALDQRFSQMLIEQFLISVDDGWILRRARFYRGAFQEEGERRGARKLLFKLAEDVDWLTTRFLQLRTATRLLPHGAETASVQEIRQLSASLSDRDASFKPLRNKIHGSPALADAAAVADYLSDVDNPALRKDYERLQSLIVSVYGADIDRELSNLARSAAGTGDVSTFITTAREGLAAASSGPARFHIVAELMASLRDNITVPNGPRLRVEMLDVGLALETELFTLGAEMTDLIPNLSRRARLGLLRDQLHAVYGAGLLSRRQFDAALNELQLIDTASTIKVLSYKKALDYLSLAPNWANQALRRYFGIGMDTLSQIEPKAALFIQDHLRGSPMFLYASLIDTLVRDANAQAGISNELFGQKVGAGLRSLNPGLARGTLRLALGENVNELDPQGIYLLPETVSELPPVAGILTEGEGNPLSHVQLLARNLAIPNVGVDQSLIQKLREYEGRRVTLAVSPAGSVRLSEDDGSLQEQTDDGTQENAPLIEVNLQKLDLTRKDFLTLSELRAEDSGRLVGPKAAKLGELKHHYPEAVAEGLAIPFGFFKDLLDQPFEPDGISLFEWMQNRYRSLATMNKGSTEHRAATETFRATLQERILQADPGQNFRDHLRARMLEVFGEDKTFGVFVRSDTNVEDLPGFTGAGLNLTVANVVGFDNIVAAISRVWASPFSARSFAWRQSLMDKPEHVYPAVLLMLSVDADKSGVLVTQDIDTGDRHWLSVAVNEGVGGAVDGQSAESLRINMNTGKARLMAEATAPTRRQVDLNGGVSKLPVSHRDRVLDNAEIEQLIVLAKELPNRFPAIVDAAGNPAPADIEFGFLDGDLRLFQIRPFLDSDVALGSTLLRALDAPIELHKDKPVALDTVP